MFFISVLLFLNSAFGAVWPSKSDDTWVGEKPTSAASVADVVVFGSPHDLYFLEILDAWKNLDKKYKSLGVRFLGVARRESKFPFEDIVVEDALKNRGITIPVYLDYNGSLSKKWKAYISPTAYIILKNDKINHFDPGNVDPVQIEKSLQKILKDEGKNNLPIKEYSNENEFKNCPSGVTYLLGTSQHNAWGNSMTHLDEAWNVKKDYVEKEISSEEAKFEISLRDSSLGILASSDSVTPAVLKVQIDKSVLNSARGKDLQTLKSGEDVVQVKNFKVYEVVSFANPRGSSEIKLTITTKSKGLKIWSLQTLPHCRVFK